MLSDEHKRDLYAFIFGLLNKRKCYVYRINGMRDHIHILVGLNPTVALSVLVRDIKQVSAIWLKDNVDFPDFVAWNEGYYAASVSVNDIANCAEYIINQELHHSKVSFMTEALEFAVNNNLEWHEKDW